MAEKKFGLNYLLNAQTQGAANTLTVRPPFTLEFDITRNVLTSANVAQFRIYNLNANNRNQIRKNVNDQADQRMIQLLAGYGEKLSLAFEGSITQAWSMREGVNFVTQIESFDGGFAFANAASDLAFPAVTEQRTVMEALVQDLAGYGVKMGAVGDVPGKLTRGNSYSGSTCGILKQLSGGRFYIDNGKAYILADHECIEGPITLINAAAGLLGTPLREQTIINFDMLFEPRLIIGQQLSLESTTTDDQNVNGTYKVISLKHRGTISEAVAGDAITSVGLLQPLGVQKLKVVRAG